MKDGITFLCAVLILPEMSNSTHVSLGCAQYYKQQWTFFLIKYLDVPFTKSKVLTLHFSYVSLSELSRVHAISGVQMPSPLSIEKEDPMWWGRRQGSQVECLQYTSAAFLLQIILLRVRVISGQWLQYLLLWTSSSVSIFSSLKNSC